ncbi:glycine cleavage system aminomethyltransferase GcvT [Consotaella salsifontis]|uniref:aminomethyltransferase n=1 Tax=Consotaella salsifontis TaxID=1365950 RepID=A0A1T4TF18_9HYPH|nr:glycine cleavage system aminomethyltransferase GcvT [Consotaella salsifontis]SKA39095.1 aminomethyltransferase [Consotaella salsifontis]
MADLSDLKKTPLFDLHEKLGARMVPFAGYAMPVQYPAGVLKEHLHTREKAGLFDVSHMGQVTIRPKSGDVRDAALALEALVPVDVAGLKAGRQRYGLFTNEDGGLLDDLMITNRGDHLFLVVNAACKEADFAHLSTHLSETCEVTPLEDRALLALQGPGAEAALEKVAPGVVAMRFMDVASFDILGAEAIVSRSGYTGEDGFEISVPAGKAAALAEMLLQDESVQPIGLGARDSLRLEAGLCLYGSDIDQTTTPVEAALEWAMQKARKKGGAREGGFPGASVILEQLHNGADRRRVGLRPQTKTPVRAGAALYAHEEGGEPIGVVTSGGFGPSVEAPVAMGYVPAGMSGAGTPLFAEVRGKRHPVMVATLPFVMPRYKRA